MQWRQVYAPVADNISGLFAALPVFFLLWALAIKRKGIPRRPRRLKRRLYHCRTRIPHALQHRYFRDPAGRCQRTFSHWLYIILTSVFLYNLIVKSGQFDVIKESIA